MRFVTTKNIFLTINVPDNNISVTDEYMWRNLYIYTSILQTCTDSPFFRFTILHDSFDSNWIQLFIESFITEIL